MKDAKGHGSDARGGGNLPVVQSNAAYISGPAHQAGVQQVGQRPALPPEGPESRELRLFADNDANLNRQSTQPIRDNLGKKMDKGVYDPTLATKLWGYHADRAAQSYAKQFGSADQPWHKMFTPAVRKEAAAHWEADERDDIKSGSSRTYKG